jgi:ANTAR domain
MDVIRVHAPSSGDARRLIAAVDGGFSASLDADSSVVALRLDSETSERVVALFNTLGIWLADGRLQTCRVAFGDRTYTLLAAKAGAPNDPTDFLFERTIQLQKALDSRVVIEQAKGIIAERDGISPEQAFERIRHTARSRRMKIQDLAAGIVATVGRMDGHPPDDSAFSVEGERRR